MHYRIGWPFWKLAHRLGFQLTFRLEVHYDPEAAVYCAESPDIKGIISEAPTIEALIKDVKTIADEMLELNYNITPKKNTAFFIVNDAGSLA